MVLLVTEYLCSSIPNSLGDSDSVTLVSTKELLAQLHALDYALLLMMYIVAFS